jgi:hypothetical protein
MFAACSRGAASPLLGTKIVGWHPDLHFGNGLQLPPNGLNDLLWPSQRPRRCGHLLDELLEMLLAAGDGLRALS